jgi:hypothetical protein
MNCARVNIARAAVHYNVLSGHAFVSPPTDSVTIHALSGLRANATAGGLSFRRPLDQDGQNRLDNTGGGPLPEVSVIFLSISAQSSGNLAGTYPFRAADR